MVVLCMAWLVRFYVQDDEYLASLLADKEKEINALKEAESHYLKEDKIRNKLLEEEVV